MVKKNALGIDVSADRISLALLKKSGNGVKLLKAASGPMPKGVIENGNIKDHTALASTINKLIGSNKMRSKWITISLFAKPVLTQIMDLPKQIPGNVGQYVHNEVKHCAILPVKNVVFDFCGIALTGRHGNNRMFVVATEGEKISPLAMALSRVGLDLEAVEPAVVASTRALYAKKVAERYDINVLIAVVEDTVVTFCVFRRQMFDFIQSRDFGEPLQSSGPVFERFVEQVNAIIQYYDIDVPDNPGKWEMVVAINSSDESSDEFGRAVKSTFAGIDVHLSLPQTLSEDTSLVMKNTTGQTKIKQPKVKKAKVKKVKPKKDKARKDKAGQDTTKQDAAEQDAIKQDIIEQAVVEKDAAKQDEENKTAVQNEVRQEQVKQGKTIKTSLAAIGLAMRSFEGPNAGLRVNLLPREVANITSVKRLALLTATAAVGMLILMVLSVGLLNMKAESMGESLVAEEQKQPSSGTQKLMKEQEIILGKIDSLTEKLENINEILQPGKVNEWDKILDSVRQSTPKALCITRMYSAGDTKITLEGQALSYESINMFGDILAKTNFIESTSLIGTGKTGVGGLITYTISCTLAKEKGTSIKEENELTKEEKGT